MIGDVMKLGLIVVIIITAVCISEAVDFYGQWMHSQIVGVPIMAFAVGSMLWTVASAWVMWGAFRE